MKETLWVRLFWLLVSEVLHFAFTLRSQLTVSKHSNTARDSLPCLKKKKKKSECFLLHGEACDPLRVTNIIFFSSSLFVSVLWSPSRVSLNPPVPPLYLSASCNFRPVAAAAAAATASFFRRYVLRTLAAPICHKFRRALCNVVDILEQYPLSRDLPRNRSSPLTHRCECALSVSLRGTSENLETTMVYPHRQLPLLLWIHHSKYPTLSPLHDAVLAFARNFDKTVLLLWLLLFFISLMNIWPYFLVFIAAPLRIKVTKIK